MHGINRKKGAPLYCKPIPYKVGNKTILRMQLDLWSQILNLCALVHSVGPSASCWLALTRFGSMLRGFINSDWRVLTNLGPLSETIFLEKV